MFQSTERRSPHHITVCIFAYNRGELFRECVDSVLAQEGEGEVVVFDDGSEGKDRDLIYSYSPKCRFFEKEPTPTATSVQEGAKRIAEQRRKAIEYFMASGSDFVFLLDSDVILGPNVLREALQDYLYLEDCSWARIGGLTLHAFAGMDGMIQVRDKVFSVVRLTGEAHMLVHRKVFERIGNPFSPNIPGGYSDTYFRGVCKKGMCVYERTLPPYPVHHAVNSTIIHTTQEQQPVWVQRCYTSNWPKGLAPLWIRGLRF